MKKLLLPFLILICLGCNENRVFNEFTDPSGNLEWNKNEIISFDIDIIDTTSKYNLIFGLRYAEGYAFENMKIEVSETSPSGSTITYPFEVRVRDENGYIGDAGYDIIDIEEIMLANRSFSEPGIYHYTIQHMMDRDKIHMVMEVGLILDKIPAQP